MSMMKTLMSAALAITMVAGASLATTQTAEAGNGRHAAFAAGAVGALVLGGILANQHYGYYGYGPVYYDDYVECRIVKERYWNGHRYKVRKVRICD
jgi:hypothetical protein